MENIQEALYSYAKRSRMRSNLSYDAIAAIWDDSELNSAENYGNLDYLIRICNEATVKTGRKAFKRVEWENFYFDSGESRQNNIGRDSFENIENKIYHGRTLKEIGDLADKFLSEIKSANLEWQVTYKVVLNFLYAEIIDETFRLYVKMSRIIIALKDTYEHYSFGLSTAIDYISGEFELLAYKDGEEAAAIKLLYNRQTKEELPSLMLQQHKIFQDINGMPVYYLTLGYNGELVSTLPL